MKRALVASFAVPGMLAAPAIAAATTAKADTSVSKSERKAAKAQKKAAKAAAAQAKLAAKTAAKGKQAAAGDAIVAVRSGPGLAGRPVPSFNERHLTLPPRR